MSQLSNHALWPELEPYLKIEVCAQDGKTRPRVRIEWRAMPAELHARAVAAQMPCVSCGGLIHFVRSRHAANKRGTARHSYYAPCCPLKVNVGCSRGAAATREYSAVRAEQASAVSHDAIQRWF